MDYFATDLLRWFDQHGRKNLPWQQTRTPYRVWIAEIMLQQTQVQTVIPYFERFITALPSLRELAHASLDQVLGLWSGLGYYSRARNLHRAAQFCGEHYNHQLPAAFDALVALPGIGRSTAGAILAQAHGERHAILDGNVKRVLARYHGVRGWPGSSKVQQALWTVAEVHAPTTRLADYTQAIMDLGALVCTRTKPRCDNCPFAHTCVAFGEQTTSQIPSPKPPKAVPTRQTTMLIVRDNRGRIFLERRPPVGVWAQLWSLPEIASDSPALPSAYKGWELNWLSSLPAFTHTFSHYRLEVKPELFILKKKSAAISDNSDQAWFTHTELTNLGLPAPVRRLLSHLPE